MLTVFTLSLATGRLDSFLRVFLFQEGNKTSKFKVYKQLQLTWTVSSVSTSSLGYHNQRSASRWQYCIGHKTGNHKTAQKTHLLNQQNLSLQSQPHLRKLTESSSVKKVRAFPCLPALPVLPVKIRAQSANSTHSSKLGYNYSKKVHQSSKGRNPSLQSLKG